jgi:chaperone required for assembly of F1-ATPase
MKRFYSTVSADSSELGWHLLLDGKPVRTPKRQTLVVPSGALAEAIAFEWYGQTDTIDPKSMPLTRLANTVLDGVVPNRAAVVAEILAFCETDLLCYRAAEPPQLVQRQSDSWNPLLDWAKHQFGAELVVTQGIVHRPQPVTAVGALRNAVTDCSVWQLAPLHMAVSITGSLVIGMALLSAQVTPEQAWAAGLLDELFQAELWGEDAEAAALRTARLSDLQDAARFLSLLRSN